MSTQAKGIAEKPVIFSAQMVRAILSGEKTQTRRAVKPQPVERGHGAWEFGGRMFASDEEMRDHLFHEVYGVKGTPYGALWHEGGDRLWVRETWASWTDHKSERCVVYQADGACREMLCDYNGEGDPVGIGKPTRIEVPVSRWRPSIHMPRVLSRITLEITNVRVERLQAISEEDAKAEGVYQIGHTKPSWVAPGVLMTRMDGEQSYHAPAHDTARDAFHCLWDSINAARGFGWDANPWCWCVEFTRLEQDHA